MNAADAEALDQVKAQASVQAGGLEEFLAESAAKLGNVGLQRRADARDDGANQRVAVRVQTRGGHRDNDIPIGHALGPQQLRGIHDAGRGARDVVVVGRHDARMLRGLAADEGRARGLTGPRDAGDDGSDTLGDDVPAGDVVSHENRARTDHDNVVDDHADQVLADRAQHGGVVGGGDGALHQLDGAVSRRRVNASSRVVKGGVGHGWCLSRVALDEAMSG